MNSIQMIHPYKFKSMWVFDDPDKGLVKEPFVAGADAIIDSLVSSIPNAENGFILLFSAHPFPSSTSVLEWNSEEGNGNWYSNMETRQMGWLCPALLKYFVAAPKYIYVQVKQGSK